MIKFRWVKNEASDKYSKGAFICDAAISLKDLKTISSSGILTNYPGTMTECGKCKDLFIVQENLIVVNNLPWCYSCAKL